MMCMTSFAYYNLNHISESHTNPTLRTRNTELVSQADWGVTSIPERKPQVPLTFRGDSKLGKWTGSASLMFVLIMH